MKKKLRRKLSVLLISLFVVGASLVLRQLHDYQSADKAYDMAQTLVVSSPAAPASVSTSSPTPDFVPTPSAVAELPDVPVPMASTPAETAQEPLEENARFLMSHNLEALRHTNDRVLGWIHIPDSPIDYPLLEVESNEEYLYRAWDGTANQSGSIFLECRNSRDLSDFNTLIYGHRMGNGTMFGMLSRYQTQEYRDSHPYVYLVTDEAVLRYEVFSAYEAAVTEDAFRIRFEDDTEKQAALEHYLTSSVLVPGLTPGTEDLILTLSTCTGTGTYNSRWVVQAVLTGKFPREG